MLHLIILTLQVVCLCPRLCTCLNSWKEICINSHSEAISFFLELNKNGGKDKTFLLLPNFCLVKDICGSSTPGEFDIMIYKKST